MGGHDERRSPEAEREGDGNLERTAEHALPMPEHVEAKGFRTKHVSGVAHGLRHRRTAEAPDGRRGG